jgi:hypothetical protein
MTFESTRSNGDWLTGVVGAGPSAGLLRFCFVLLHAHTLANAMIASATTIRFELSILIYADLNIASLIFPKLVQYLLAQLGGQAWPPADVTCVAVSGCRKPYGLQFFYLLEFVTFRTQSIGGGR